MYSAQQNTDSRTMKQFFYIPLAISVVCLLIIFAFAIFATEENLISIVIFITFIGGVAQVIALTSPLYFLFKNKFIPVTASIILTLISFQIGFIIVALTGFSIYGNSLDSY